MSLLCLCTAPPPPPPPPADPYSNYKYQADQTEYDDTNYDNGNYDNGEYGNDTSYQQVSDTSSRKSVKPNDTVYAAISSYDNGTTGLCNIYTL